MSGPIETTLEEASRCPKCEEPGRYAGERSLGPHGRQGKAKIFECENNRCKWFGTTWIVQVGPDGTIPPPTTVRDKQFKELKDDPDKIRALYDRQLELETKPGAEISRGR